MIPDLPLLQGPMKHTSPKEGNLEFVQEVVDELDLPPLQGTMNIPVRKEEDLNSLSKR